MLKNTITEQIKLAMRARDAVRSETLRFILSQIKYAEIEKQRALTEEELVGVLSAEVKKRREAIKLFRDSNRDELVLQEEAKLSVITSLLPAQMGHEEIAALVDAAIVKLGKSNLGMIMKELIPATKGRADGALVSQIVKDKLAQ